MATTKALRRLTATVLTLTATLAASPVWSGDWMPLLPSQDFYDFQIFAPPDLQQYEIYPELSEGIFFSYDRLYWGITPPRVAGVGTTNAGGYLIPSQPISPQALVQLNNANIQAGDATGTGNVIGGLYIYGADPLQLDLNTSWMRTMMSWGNRFEGGWIYDNRGVNLSYFDTGDQSQSFVTNSEFAASSPTQIFTQTSTGGGVQPGAGGGGIGNINQALITTTITANSPPPDHLIAQKLTQEQSTRIQSAGAALIIRRELGRRGSGSSVRFGVGPRFLQFEDRFTIGYESNQYAFNTNPFSQAGFGGVNVGAQLGAGNLGNLVANPAQAGGPGGVGGGPGGFGGGNNVAGAGAQNNLALVQTSAGDVLGITGVDTLTGVGRGSPLQVGAWETSTFNNMVGPEFALLLETTRGRWTWTSELKFTAGFNWQNSIYRGSNFPDSIGADYLRATFNPSVTNVSTGGASNLGNTVQLTPPPLFLQVYGVGQNNATNAAEHSFVFTPIGEWRFGGQFRVSQAITLRAGYTGMWLGSIARASTNTIYKSDVKATQYAEVADPTQKASITNPWIVKTTGPRPAGVDPTDPRYTDASSPYYRPDPVYNRIAPTHSTVQEYVFTNGVDFGIEVKY